MLPILADALLESLRSAQTRTAPAASSLLIPLIEAISRLLYTFCKIRGEKVVVRFFGAETRYLELLLSAVERATHKQPQATQWSWEERYIVLLWLSHLLLVPFDLASISSGEPADVEQVPISGLIWPAGLPGVALRIVPIAIKYLGAAGKERDAAKVLLVRLSLRKDMQQLGLLDALVGWALMSLRTLSGVSSAYYFIGILSFLAGVLASSSTTSDMDAYLNTIFSTVQDLDATHPGALQSIHSTALARKTMIKVLRTIAIMELRGSTKSSPPQATNITETVEAIIGHMLEALASNDTPVRIAASKALSVITLKLAPEMAEQVVEAVIDSLNHNVFWNEKTIGGTTTKIADVSAVNASEWHGQILTLSQLLYRRSPPASTLSRILHSLLVGLTFERRSTSGSSIGTNVRDAACFGLWSLARRYTTAELQAIDKSLVITADHYDEKASILQILATELVVAACLDSAGNIRRGASAALQELIGRHPNTVVNGIALVQTVDYHKVARRSKAMLLVAPEAALLSKHNEDALLNALFGWRGIGDGDAISRRNAADCIGTMSSLHLDAPTHTSRSLSDLIERIERHLQDLKAREVESRHGLLLSLAAVIGSVLRLCQTWPARRNAHEDQESEETGALVSKLFQVVNRALEGSLTSTYRRPELIAEAICRLIPPVCRLLELKSDEPTCTRIDSCLEAFMDTSDVTVTAASTAAAVSFLSLVGVEQRSMLVEKWCATISSSHGRQQISVGHLMALGGVFELADSTVRRSICSTFRQKWLSNSDTESRAAILTALHNGQILASPGSDMIELISEGLDDYTIDARGDVGSLVRIEALKAAASCFRSITSAAAKQEDVSWSADAAVFIPFYAKIIRLAVEKLDKVRAEAHRALCILYEASVDADDTSLAQDFKALSVSSEGYFAWFLELQQSSISLLPAVCSQMDGDSTVVLSMLEGYVTSADTGSENLIKASRAALTDFCYVDVSASNLICGTLLQLAKTNLHNDRIMVPVLEVMSFLFDAGIMAISSIS